MVTMTKKNLTLDDLKTGMIVTVRSGEEYIVLRNRAKDDLDGEDVFVRYTKFHRGFSYFREYNNDFTAKYYNEFDIVKVEVCPHPYGILNPEYRKQDRVTIWEETPAVKLTVAEIEARLGYKIEIVSEEE